MNKVFHHDYESVEDYLHHRPPYLMIDRIITVTTKSIETEKRITGEEFFLPGHFPGVSIFPGAMMQEFATQSAGVLIAARHNPMEIYNTHDPSFNRLALGVLVRVSRAKYLGFARLGDTLRAKVLLSDCIGNIFDFTSTIHVGERVIMKNRFRLSNVPTETLIGEAPSAKV